MKVDQKTLAENRSKSGGSKLPKQPTSRSCDGREKIDQMKVSSYGIQVKKEK
jgi:hypothetical protein